MLKVGPILIDEIEDLLRDSRIISPCQPVLHGWFDVEYCPTVKLRWVHLANLILCTMLATIDCGEDECVVVELVSVQLT